MMDGFNEMWDGLIGLGVSEETLQIVCCILGSSTETLDDIEFAVNGTHDLIDGGWDDDE